MEAGKAYVGIEAAVAVSGMTVELMNPRQVKDSARTAGRLAKTDTINARVLAHFAPLQLVPLVCTNIVYY